MKSNIERKVIASIDSGEISIARFYCAIKRDRDHERL